MLPAMRQSHGRTRRRRAHDSLTPVVSTSDPIDGTPKLPHRASRSTGYVRAGLRIRVPKLKIGIDRD